MYDSNRQTTHPPQVYSRNAASFQKHDVEEDEVVMRFDAFMTALESDEGLNEALEADTVAVIEAFELLPGVKDDAEGHDLRKEVLIERLVGHIRDSMHAEHAGSVHLDPECTTTTAWIIKVSHVKVWTRPKNGRTHAHAVTRL